VKENPKRVSVGSTGEMAGDFGKHETFDGADVHSPGHGLTRGEIEQIQQTRLRVVLQHLQHGNRFYAAKLAAAGLGPVENVTLDEFRQKFPFTTKEELTADQQAHPPYGTNLSFQLEKYTRCHQTSGSTGTPLRWLDTPESWQAMLDNWDVIFDAAQITPSDRLLFAFSFGPFIGFWTAFEAAVRRGNFCLATGAMTSEARLMAIRDHRISVLLCTPTYALHLGEIARANNFASDSLRVVLTAGEPGGCIPGVRSRLGQLWPGARVFDHHGMTESGPVTFECPARTGVLHVIESAFLAEVLEAGSERAVAPGGTGELVLTTLRRDGSPLIRYRTGDLVRRSKYTRCACGRYEMALPGGILGRLDDMVFVRGVNIYPAAIDNIVRSFREIAEYRVLLATKKSMAEIEVEIETIEKCMDESDVAARLQRAFQTAFNLRIPVKLVPRGSLPHFEMKGRRWLKI